MTVQKIYRFLPMTTRARLCRTLGAGLGLVAVLLAGNGVTAPAALAVEDVWSDLRSELFGERRILDGADRLQLTAPYRAHDAALVPVAITLKGALGSQNHVKAVTLVIDQNPAPVAAVFKMAPDSGVSKLATRVRVNSYSDIRVIAEMQDGKLYMVKRFVKASGGCSAPASKNADIARRLMGKMKLRQFSQKGVSSGQSSLAEVQIMVRHMNNSGLQRDQLTGLYIPAHFINSISIKQAGKPLMDVEGAISLSENPTLRFSFLSHGAAKLDVVATDTEGGVFKGTWRLRPVGKHGS